MYQQIFALFFINSLFSLVHHISLFSNAHVYFYLNNLVQKLALYKSSSHYNNICLNSLDFLLGGEGEGRNCLKDRAILKKKEEKEEKSDLLRSSSYIFGIKIISGFLRSS